MNNRIPNVTIEGPPIDDIEIKRQLVKEITNALEKAYKLPREVYTILIRENLSENVGVGGELLIDRRRK
ncbi:MAG: 4-oxalocrotonate tautomerase DmpI [Promethearchaeota archaeon]